jgi:hypothetical protein
MCQPLGMSAWSLGSGLVTKQEGTLNVSEGKWVHWSTDKADLWHVKNVSSYTSWCCKTS